MSNNVLVCAFNKSIQMELAERLNQPPDKGREWSTQQNAIFDNFVNGPGEAVVLARASAAYTVVKANAGTGKTTTIIEGVRRIPGNAESLTLHSAGFRLLQGAMGYKVKVAKDEEFVELQDLTEAFIESQGEGIDGALIRFLKNNGVTAKIQKVVSWVKGTDPLFRKLEPFVAAAEQLAADLDLPNGQEQEALLAIAKIAMKSCIERERAFRNKTQRWATFDDMVWAPVRLFSKS